MNNAIKVEAILTELRSNSDNIGEPPTNDFSALCDYVTKWMMKKYDLRAADSINWGYCFIWAYLVWALWPKDELTFKTCTGHVVIKRGEFYYDSEHIHGCSDLTKFCSFQRRAEDGTKHVDINWMCWYWTRAGRQLGELRRLIRKTHPKLYAFARASGSTHWKNSVQTFIGYEHIGKLPEVA